jgi:hypothetical protein
MWRPRLLVSLVLLLATILMAVQRATADPTGIGPAKQQLPCTVPKAFGKYVDQYIFEDANGTIRHLDLTDCTFVVVITRK